MWATTLIEAECSFTAVCNSAVGGEMSQNVKFKIPRESDTHCGL